MTPVRMIVRDYCASGSVNQLLAPWGFVDDYTFLTKGGQVGVVYRLAGVDDECLDPDERRAIVHRYEAAARLLDESCRVYQYLCKRRVDPLTPVPCSHPAADAAVRRRTAFLH